MCEHDELWMSSLRARGFQSVAPRPDLEVRLDRD